MSRQAINDPLHMARLVSEAIVGLLLVHCTRGLLSPLAHHVSIQATNKYLHVAYVQLI
jgi:hypothetical protein